MARVEGGAVARIARLAGVAATMHGRDAVVAVDWATIAIVSGNNAALIDRATAGGVTGLVSESDADA
jgi:hypothetical protein